MMLQHGEKIDQYTILNKLGQGGMSDVYLAQDDSMQRQVVLKFPHPEILGDPATYERFTREMKIGGLLDHPNIPKMYGVGGEKVAPYMIMEFVAGKSLREILSDVGPLPKDRAIQMIVQIARALAYAHSRNVYHRDLKPENIMVLPGDLLKVMDFGIAFIEGARRVTWGKLSSQVGTPDYMSPERIKGKRGDVRSDIYALGIMAYEFFAGHPPYKADNPLSIMNQHVTVDAPLLSRYRKDVPPLIEEIIMKAIYRDPEARWESMDSFADALESPEKLDLEGLRAERHNAAKKPAATRSMQSGSSIQTAIAVVPIFALLAAFAIGVVLLLIFRHP